MAEIGASRPLRLIPAIVFFLNQQPALRLVGGNRSSCAIGHERSIASRRKSSRPYSFPRISAAAAISRRASSSVPTVMRR